MIYLCFAIKPVAKGRPRFTRQGRTYSPRETKAFEMALRSQAYRQLVSKPLLGALKLKLRFHLERPKRTKNEYPSVRPDLDNYLKAVLDAMNGVLWVDDGQVVCIETEKVYARPEIGPSIELWLEIYAGSET